jgi:ATP-binding cassette subfamily B protein
MFPRVAVEAIGILLMVGLVLYLSRASRDLMAMLPTLGLIAVGAQKLIPLLQQVYAGWSGVVTGQKSVDDVLGLLDFSPIAPPASPIEFRGEITLENACFSYPAAPERPVLANIDLAIRRGEKIGIVGATGGGKSTLVDMLMGLLPPTAGRLAVDNPTITPQNSAAWQRHVAHVPQSIYLSDASVAENIAFGVVARRIDQARVERAAKAAGIHDHIASLPEGYLTPVGERGIRLSGGQRQRLGIARALYKDVDVLVLDEATSALDDETEARVMAAIGELASDMTVIMIAHRLSTMRWCDRIIEIDHGHFRRQLDFATLIRERATAGA